MMASRTTTDFQHYPPTDLLGTLRNTYGVNNIKHASKEWKEMSFYQEMLFFSYIFSFQGLLSTTFVADVYYVEDGNDSEVEKKSIFVKVPLTGDASKNFKQVEQQQLV